MSWRRFYSRNYMNRSTILFMHRWTFWEILRVAITSWRYQDSGIAEYDMGPRDIAQLLDLLTAELSRRIGKYLDI